MPYVSAKYMAPDPIAPPDAPKPVQAVDDQGQVWSLNEDSQVGDWVNYLANGGTIDPADPVVEAVPVAQPEVVYGDPTIADLNARIAALEAQLAAKE